jgi:hypothetical protein
MLAKAQAQQDSQRNMRQCVYSQSLRVYSSKRSGEANMNHVVTFIQSSNANVFKTFPARSLCAACSDRGSFIWSVMSWFWNRVKIMFIMSKLTVKAANADAEAAYFTRDYIANHSASIVLRTNKLPVLKHVGLKTIKS